MGEHWRDLVAVALLGTDRRDPPVAPTAIADLVADTASRSPSQRLLADVAATAVVRRAGIQPGPALDELAPPELDERPLCPQAATERWHHITASWPVLEDEWVLALLSNGWRVSPDLVPLLLARHRRDPVRRARVIAATGPLGDWLVEHVDDLEATGRTSLVGPDEWAELPTLPISVELAQLLDLPGGQSGDVLARSIEDGALAGSHKPMLVNLVARVRSSSLDELARALDGVDPTAPGHGLASVLADLAVTRRRMLDELAAEQGSSAGTLTSRA